MTLKNSIFPALLLLLALLVLAGCKAAEDEKHYGGPDTGPVYGDWFVDASIGDASTLLPPLAQTTSPSASPGWFTTAS